MALFRVVATMIDDGDHNPDPETKIVLHVKIDDENHIDLKMETFGYNVCWDDESGYYPKFPFLLTDSGDPQRGCRLNYEGWDNETDDRLNLDTKKIKVGETFTYFECSFNPILESVYCIKSVHPL